ncbi:uncharacterized protein YbcV (DUF1398 family) [Dysgonomonas alginatilytica]|uniref:Uncharacterized protein YbcV (DUF1398 family) n=1 Tax=Dysgonomonas alginatilytica TaxID=1605892 RepID=A0A2V3PT34_9BACT|nr:DUF1398 family protein [Dysgonomonas alginatilytica]PXV67358.1 uncharacterized protein YbcV (DUF1398 family) [Dysgonomonas alginatilytica]
MFTLHEIEEIHSRVKSGADFPRYIQELTEVGIISYSIYVNDGHADYHGKDNFHIASDAKHATLLIAENGDIERLKHALAIHQQGQTNYMTFCKHSAAAGVQRWTVDIAQMLCTYYDKNGKIMLLEHIPTI